MKVRAKSQVRGHELDEFDNQHLTPGKEYVVIGLSGPYLRVVDDSGDPILYPRILFDVLDAKIPADWVARDDRVDPPEFANIGFYEAVFEGDSAALQTLAGGLQRMGVR